MGGYNVGELSGALNLDDSQFKEALRASAQASRIFRNDVKSLQKDLEEVVKVFEQAGINTTALKAAFNDNSGVEKTRAGFMALADAIETVITASGKLKGASEVSTELENFQARAEAERLHLEQIQQAKAAQADYSNLTRQLYSAESKANQDRINGLAAEAAFRRRRDQEAADSARDYANLIFKLKQEEEKAAHDAKQKELEETLAADAKMRDSAEKAAQDRAKELRTQYEGDLAYFDRTEKEKIETQRKAIAEQLRQERLKYEQYRQMQHVANAAQQVGLAATAAGGAGLASTLFVAKDAAEFQDAMAKSLAIIGEVTEATKSGLARAARDAALETGLAAKDIAKNYETIAKGGRTSGEAMQEIGMFAKYAVANEVTLHDATKQVLTVMESLKLGADQTGHTMDILTAANKLNRDSVDQLATALEGKGGAALRSFGVGLEDAVALSVLYARSGIEGAKAQTVMAQLTNSFTESVRKHGDMLLKVNGEQVRWRDIVYDSTGRTRTFNEVMLGLSSAFKNFSPKDVNDGLGALGLSGVRTVNALKPLLGSEGALAVIKKSIVDMGQATESTFGAQMDSPLKQLDRLKAQFTELAITIGTPVVAAMIAGAKALSPLLDMIKDAVTWFGKLPEPVQQVIANFALIGSTSLVAGGGMLMTASAVIRLAADIALLNSSGYLAGAGGLVSLLGGAALAAGSLAAAILAVSVAFSVMSSSKKALEDKGIAPTPSNSLAVGGLPWLVNMFVGTDNAKKDAKKAGEDIGGNFKDGVLGKVDQARKDIEEATKEIMKAFEGFKNPPAVTDPNKNAQERARLFGNFGLPDYQTKIAQLKKDLQEAIASGIFNPAQIAAARESIAALEDQWANFGKAITGVTATNKVGTAALILQMDEIKKAFKDAHDYVVKFNADFYSGKAGHPENVPLPAEAFTTRQTDILNHTTESAKQWNIEVAKVGDELDRINAAMVKEGRSGPGGPDSELLRIEAYAKFHGIKLISQTDLNDQAEYAKRTLDDIYAYQAAHGSIAAQTLYSAQVAFIEAEARKRHESAQDYARSIGFDYDLLRRKIEDTVAAGNSALRRFTQSLGRDFQRIFGDIASGFIGLIDVFGANDTSSSKIDNLTKSFRDAYEQLSAYNDPKKALEDLIHNIQNAGTQAQANALAVKYFGATAGPLLAKELRDGTLAAKDIDAAIKAATVSTQEYGNTTDKHISRVTEIWHKAVNDILQIITKRLIELGFKALIDWIFKVGSSTTTVAQDVVAAIRRIGEAIGVLSKTTKTVSNAGEVLDDTGAVISTGTKGVTPPTLPPTGGPSGGGGGAGSAASGVMGIINVVSGVVTAVSSVIGNFQMHGMNKALDVIVLHTLQTANDLANLRRDQWDRHYGLLAKFDMIFNRLGDIWGTLQVGLKVGGGAVAEAKDYTGVLGSINYAVTLILSKFDNFVVPDLQMLVGGNVPTLSPAGAAGTVLNFYGPVTVSANSTGELIRTLKSRRTVRGL